MRDGLLHIGRFEERSITRAAGIISTLVSAILLLGSITALYFVQVAIARLFMIYIFTTLFALSVALTTNARRAELFAATAAFVLLLPYSYMTDAETQMQICSGSGRLRQQRDCRSDMTNRQLTWISMESTHACRAMQPLPC